MTKKLSDRELRRRGFLPPTALLASTKRYKAAAANSKKAKERLEKAYNDLVTMSQKLNWKRPPTITGTEYKLLPKTLQARYKLDDNVLEAFEVKVYNLTSNP